MQLARAHSAHPPPPPRTACVLELPLEPSYQITGTVPFGLHTSKRYADLYYLGAQLLQPRSRLAHLPERTGKFSRQTVDRFLRARAGVILMLA
jgi:hypothetical protein